MTVAVWNRLDLDEEAGEEGIDALVSDFTTARENGDGVLEDLNLDIENFLKKNALQFAREKKSITYLVCDEDDGSLQGYFTITHKAVEVPPAGLSKTYIRKVERYAQLHKELNSYIVSGFLIAQFGKNYGVDEGSRITGSELMQLCNKELYELQHRLGGGLEYLDCEAHAELIDFYEKQNFRLFGERISEKDGKRYLQFMKFI